MIILYTIKISILINFIWFSTFVLSFIDAKVASKVMFRCEPCIFLKKGLCKCHVMSSLKVRNNSGNLIGENETKPIRSDQSQT